MVKNFLVPIWAKVARWRDI